MVMADGFAWNGQGRFKATVLPAVILVTASAAAGSTMPTAIMTDTIPTRTMMTTTMTAVATLSVAACIPATAGGFDRSRSADNMLAEKTRRFTPAGFSCNRGTFAPLAGYDNSGGTGKPAVAYEAARSHARAAFLHQREQIRPPVHAGNIQQGVAPKTV
jgi:hypothetical protein